MSKELRENKEDDPGFLRSLAYRVGAIPGLFFFTLSASGIFVRNWRRRLFRQRIDFIVLPIGGSLPERSGPPRSFIQRQLPLPPLPMSMESLNRRITRISDARNVYGVVFVFRGMTAGMATLTNLRRSMERLRKAGKKVVVYTPHLDLSHYYAATAADLIVVPPSARFEVLGIRSEVTFLKDAIDKLGIQTDVVQISPYKTGYDAFSRSDISDEHREQLDWILEDSFQTLIQTMASGRGMTADEISALIDEAPLNPEEALEKNLVDFLAYEDKLPYLLPEAFSVPEQVSSSPKKDSPGHDEEEKSVQKDRYAAKISGWNQARKILIEKPRKKHKKYIGVVSIDGIITMGQSRKPPVDLPVPMMSGESAGETTITEQLRRAERDPQMAGLIVLIDSPGGLALASDLVWRQIFRLSQKKPVLAYMRNVAASGGYYVASPAHHIMSQPTTITGSIGVLAAHISTRDLYAKLSINRVVMGRGKNVQMLSDSDSLNEEQLTLLWKSLVHSYDQFKRVVADGRGLPFENLDEICSGRVWTGSQALDHKLVDSHGDFQDAVAKTAELAGIEVDDINKIPVYTLRSGDGDYLPPQPLDPIKHLLEELRLERIQGFNNKPLAIMPYNIRIR